ncbi:MAG: ion channel [Bryobacteraceae bacterium]|jgi:inward rectifier potassium channel
MRKPSFDPGLTEKFISPISRAINPDGSFNVRRQGTTWRDFHPYLHLINMGWTAFFATLVAGYTVANLLFAAVYFLLGPDQLQGADAATAFGRFLNDFFFSSHTLSTVGYGNIAPKGLPGNFVAAGEALIGVLGFAVATGLLFGRISRPSARIGFSRNLLVAPYQEGQSLQFRVVNRRANSLMDLEARVMLMTVEPGNGQLQRRYDLLNLERTGVMFLALTWTVVHPIDSGSPLWGKTPEEIARLQPEIMILIKAYDDTFSQTVLTRHSYTFPEFVFGARFAPAFHVDPAGDIVLDVPKVSKLLE